MPKKCFVMMPSGANGEYKGGIEESDYIFSGIIRRAVSAALGDDTYIAREADQRKPGAITSDIVKQIAEYDIAIVDITGQNPNVFLELGIRYALRRCTTIILKQHDTPVPFDVAGFRFIEYKSTFHGVELARKDIQAALEQASGDGYCDSLVFEVYPHLEITNPDPISRMVNSENRMPWSAYRQSMSQLIESAIQVVKDGRYAPVTIIGMTNGGAMFADLLTRELFSRVPMVCLWANRTQHFNYFDNEINNALVQGVATLMGSVEKPGVLLVDDIVASGGTHHQALQFLEKHLNGVDIRFLPLFSRNSEYFQQVMDRVLWKHPAFDLADQEILRLHDTEWRVLPYGKDIRSS